MKEVEAASGVVDAEHGLLLADDIAPRNTAASRKRASGGLVGRDESEVKRPREELAPVKERWALAALLACKNQFEFCALSRPLIHELS